MDPDLLAPTRIPPGEAPQLAQRNPRDTLGLRGTAHRHERERVRARLDEPDKHRKFNRGDVDMRAHWEDVMAAFEEAIAETSTDAAPRHVVPADLRSVRNAGVAQLVVSTLRTMGPGDRAADPDLDDAVVT